MPYEDIKQSKKDINNRFAAFRKELSDLNDKLNGKLELNLESFDNVMERTEDRIEVLANNH